MIYQYNCINFKCFCIYYCSITRSNCCFESENDNEVLLSVVYLLDIKKNPYKVTASPIHNTPLDTQYHCFRFTRLRKQQEKLTFLQITHQKSTACNLFPVMINPTSYRKINKSKNRYSLRRWSFRLLTDTPATFRWPLCEK